MNDYYLSCPERRRGAVCQTEDAPYCVHCGQYIYGRNDGVMNVYVYKDVFNAPFGKLILAQQVNCRGVMGSGLAKAIRDRYPEVYEHYRAEYELGLLKLGYTSYIEVNDNPILIANICGQERYGRDGKQYTDYEALRKGLEDVKMMAHDLGLDVVIPHGIGCGLGGGDWEGVVYPFIREIFKEDLIIEGVDDFE